MLINLIRFLVGKLSIEDKQRLYDLLGVIVKSAVEGAAKGMTK